MILLFVVGTIGLIFGIIFDAVGSLQYFLAVLSLLAVVSASLLMLASGLDILHLAMGSLGLSGLLTSWDRLFTND